MKKTLFSLAIVALGASAIVSCNKANEFAPNNAQEVTINLLLPAEAKSAFTDAEGLQWTEGDKIFWLNTDGGGNAEYTLTNSDITGGNVASFKTTIPGLAGGDVHGWFKYNTHGNLGNNEVIFSDLNGKISKYGTPTCGNGITTLHQSAAGVANPAIFALQSSIPTPQTIAEGTSEINVQMRILGTVFRVIPYTTTHNSESITKVEFSSTSNIAGTVEYQPSGTYRPPFWAEVKEMNVVLDTPMSLSGVTDKASSHGIYFSLPQTDSPIAGYKYVVYTDQADYTFTSAADLVVGNNEVKNVYLNLERGVRLGNEETIGKYWYDGSLAGGYAGNALNYTAAATDVNDLGYWTVYTQEDSDNSVNQRGVVAYPDFYTNTTITIIDNATGVAPTWMTFGYVSSTSDHLKIHLDANDGAERSATITFGYPAVAHHYGLRAGEPAKTITVTQAANAVVEPTISTEASLSITNGKHFDLTATLGFEVNGTPASDSEFNSYIASSTLTATNARVKRSGRTVTLEVLPNPLASARDIVLTLDYQGTSETLTFTQAAAASAYQPPYKYTISGWTRGQGDRTYNIAGDGTGASDWLCAFTALQKWDGGAWVNVTDKAQVDMEELCDQMFGTDDDSRWVNLVWNSFSAYAGECIIRTQEGTPATANTGAARSFTGSVMEYDHSSHIFNFTLNQVKAPVALSPGDNYWPTLDVSTSDSYYGPGWAAQAFPSIAKGANNSSYSFTIPTACSERWQCQLKMVTDLPALDAGKTYDFSVTFNCSNAVGAVRIQLMTAGIGYPVDDDFNVNTADSDMVFSKQFTGYALVNSTLILDFGYAPAGTDVVVKNIILKEHID